ncbi:helix-turn-helix transcriptional regulator [Streptomyces sp. NPDC058008]|uniref:helix-turn-helix transcriptional regulator n=1 Tax=Streptomyces sp. NPDC058008 TaxID=3346303 RepID=UPI0036EC2E76
MDRTDNENLIGQYLRARRQLVRPQDLGLAPGVRRRVPGLRREEVAMLAGMSTDYYTRLEQGRERHPSAQVVGALARVLMLDEEATAHLGRLAAPPARRPGSARRERVDEGLLLTMDAWADTPAIVLGPYLNVLAHNHLGRALYAGHAHSDDLARLVFLDPEARAFYADWDQVAANTVAELRASAGDRADDPGLIDLVGELSLRSEPFRRLWARHDVRHKTREAKRFQHPLVGELHLAFQALSVNGATAQQLVVYRAEPGSPSAHALALLGSLTAAAPGTDRPRTSADVLDAEAGDARHRPGRPDR